MFPALSQHFLQSTGVCAEIKGNTEAQPRPQQSSKMENFAIIVVNLFILDVERDCVYVSAVLDEASVWPAVQLEFMNHAIFLFYSFSLRYSCAIIIADFLCRAIGVLAYIL